MGNFEINFEEVRLRDIAYKRKQPKWSGQEVLPFVLDNQKSVWVAGQLNMIRVWPQGFRGFLKRLRYVLRIIVKSSQFEAAMTFAVLLNTITLSIDHYGISPEIALILKVSNDYFTWIFVVEMFAKLLAIGVAKYCADRMNYLDGTVVMLSLIELASIEILAQQGLGLRSFETVRIIRASRVFRVARLLRGLESMKTILGVMMRSYKSFIYITMLMFLFIIIFSLLGMQTFGGKFQNLEDGIPANNYDSFVIAFITVFQVLTMENWQTVLFSSMRSDVNKYVVSIYYISWIFLGNFILLNLFLAILLDSFLEEQEEDDESKKEEEELQKAKMQRKLKKKKFLDAQKLFMDFQAGSEEKKVQASKFYFGEAMGDSEEDLQDLDEDQVEAIFKEDLGLISRNQDDIKAETLFSGISCENSLYIFSQTNWIRVQSCVMIKHAWFETTVQGFILLSSMKLAFDTYIIDLDKDSQVHYVSNQINTFFSVAFITEMSLKVIAVGLLMDEGSYLRDAWNQIDFFIVISSILDILMSSLEIPVIKILRMLRVLRPLRFISHNVAMKMVVTALIESMGHIFNVLIVVAVIYLIFAIVGVNFFGGKFFYCNINMYQIETDKDCLLIQGQWKRWDHNFDTVLEAMNTLYVVSSLEGWPDIMKQAVDMTGEQLGPTQENSKAMMFYFVTFILVGSFFFLNFFIGVLFLKYNQAQKEEQRGFAKKDLDWMDI